MKRRIVLKSVLCVSLLLICGGLGQSQTTDSDDAGFGEFFKDAGLSPASIKIQKSIHASIPDALRKGPTEQTTGKGRASFGVFKPDPKSTNFQTIAKTLSSTEKEENDLVALFEAVQKIVEEESGPKGRSNNIAAALSFLMTTSTMGYTESPTPKPEVSDNLFLTFDAMFNRIPEMANMPNKDKQFLYDTYLSLAGFVFLGYVQAREANDKESLQLFRSVSGSLLREFIRIDPDSLRFEGNTIKVITQETAQKPVNQTVKPQESQNRSGITKYITNFDDGWVATPKEDWVQVERSGTEVRLHFVNKQFDDARPNTVEPKDYYWNMAVAPYFNVGSAEHRSGVEYPVIYFMQGDAVDKRTGKRCFVAMKVVFDGGGRVVVAVAPDRATYQREFPHPNDLNGMLAYNKFGVAAQDVVGTWAGGGGGGVEYYSAYSGTYTGMSAVSTTDEFVFNSNGNYQSTHNSANMNSVGTRFAKIEYKGNFSVNDWELMATNRVSGKSKNFWCRLEAVRGGYLLILTDSDYEPLVYTLFKKS